jgi:glycosyltransferase involved in cell wall biosynthesis
MKSSVVAALYQAFDVLLMPSMGEGFGIPLLEAQACGVPVISSDHSAMTELAQAGWLVSGDPWWDSLQNSFLICPSIDGVLAALEASYEARDDQRLRDAAAAFALAYDADTLTETHWKPALATLSARREVPPLNLNGNRAQRRAAKRQKVTA